MTIAWLNSNTICAKENHRSSSGMLGRIPTTKTPNLYSSPPFLFFGSAQRRRHDPPAMSKSLAAAPEGK